jgi:catechol-2,3-dioxygenase
MSGVVDCRSPEGAIDGRDLGLRHPAGRKQDGFMPTFPVLMHTALDATDCRGLAEFYREFLGLRYRPGDEPAADGTADDPDWLVLLDESGNRVLAFNRVDTLTPATWPSDDVPKQMHHDFQVPDRPELERQRRRAQDLGAALVCDRSDEKDEPLYVLADPAGHPFCILVLAG